MNREQFDALIRRLEPSASARPGLFIARVAALAFFGYAYMLGVFVLMLGLLALSLFAAVSFRGALTIKLGLFALIVFGGMAWAILKSLWVRLEAPTGLEITREAAPELFRMIDELGRALNSPRFDVVQLSGDYNAAVCQVPRLGILGWHRNYLLLGLPLMVGLGPGEFRAVLAHEFGHLSGGHGRLGNWLYRLRRTWQQVFEELARQQQGRMAFIVTWFIEWYWPKFNAHAFVLSRTNEYEADAAAARLAGAHHLAHALQRSKVHGIALEEHFWPSILRRANSEPTPPSAVYDELAVALKRGLSAEETARWIKASFLVQTNNLDTHPCLRDRLLAMTVLPEGVPSGRFPESLPEPEPVSAAEYFLGPALGDLTARLNRQWADAISILWGQRHQHAVQLAASLQEAEGTAVAPDSSGTSGAAPDPVEPLWRKASALMDLEGDAAALPTLERILAIRPDHALARFVVGRHWISRDEARGVEELERAMAQDASLVREGCDLLYAYYSRTGQKEKLRPIENRVDRHQDLELAAQRERANVRASDTFLPAGITGTQLEMVRGAIAAEADVAVAWIARKQVQHFPDSPCYVIAVKIDVPFFSLRSTDANQKVIDRVIAQLQLPGYALVFCDEGNLKSLAAAVREAGQEVFRRGPGS